jgi:hypothetical protein
MHKKMHKNYKSDMITGNTIRYAGNNKKTSRNFIIINGEKHKIGKNNLNNNSSKTYKNYDLDDY